MRKHLNLGLSTALFSLLFMGESIAQTSDTTQAGSVGERDAPSGWARLELAVYIDTDKAALSSEVWDAFPDLNYSDQRRWLINYDEINALKDIWGEAAVKVNTNGSVQVFPEPPSAPEVSLPEADLSDSPLLATSGDPEPGETASVLPFDESAPDSALEGIESGSEVPINIGAADEALTGSAAQVPLETLSLASRLTPEAEDTTENGVLTSDQTPQSSAANEVLDRSMAERGAQPLDLLNSDEFTVGADLPGNLDAESSGSQTLNWLDTYADDENTPAEPRPLVDVEAPLALPATYQHLPVEMLAQGIESLRKTSDKSPVISLAWLQAPEDIGTPIVVDTWLENASHPVLQGTVKIDVNVEATLDIDLWMNALGETLPPKYTPLVPHPQAPQRVLVIEHSTASENTQKAEDVEYIDVGTGLNRTTDDASSNGRAAPPSADINQPPPRQAIALRETRSLRQGYIRYIDHPAIQVVATWRELSFKEVYELGEAQRIRRDIDSLTRTLTTPDRSNSNSLAP